MNETNMTDRIAELRRMTVGQLRERFAEVFGEESRSWNRGFLWRRIAWQIQAMDEGRLSERARRRAEELANEAFLRTRPPKEAFASRTTSAVDGDRRNGPGSRPSDGTRRREPSGRRLPIPGTMLRRVFRGRTVLVTVRESGFEWEGRLFQSLTAVANAATGSHWNGFEFFREALQGTRSRA